MNSPERLAGDETAALSGSVGSEEDAPGYHRGFMKGYATGRDYAYKKADARERKIIKALHDAIRSPMGTVPKSAEPFYSQMEAARAEVRREARQAKGEQ